mgnify:CR=1 FL=1|tara:strand:+ start:3519 stop:4466 length:948 start_codon:yes stop_codon:yes gene_type:complete
MEVSTAVLKSAIKIANDIKARSILVLTETGHTADLILSKKIKTDIPIIIATVNEKTFQRLLKKTMINVIDVDFIDVETKKTSEKVNIINLITRGNSRIAKIEDAVTMCIKKGLLKDGDIIIIITSSFLQEADSVVIYEVKNSTLDHTLYDFLQQNNVNLDVFENALKVSLEIGREGREGRLIGTAFILGDTNNVIENSKQLILNPFEGQMIGERLITNKELHESIKEIAQLDGAFIINGDGIIEAAGRYLTVDSAGVSIPQGLGTRHAAVAAMTMITKSLGITVSKSGGIVRIFRKGKVMTTIEPKNRIVFKTDS